MDVLRTTLFKEKFEVDDREQTVVFSLPYLGHFGLTPCDPLFWHQIFVLVLLGSVLNVLLAVLVYVFVIKKSGTLTSYLFGYGFVLPSLMYAPFLVIKALDLRNMSMIVGSAAGPVLLFFRCLEAMHGGAPSFATQSLHRYVMYFAATVQFEVDPKTQQVMPVTQRHLMGRFLAFMALFGKCTLMFSVLLPVHFTFFPRRPIKTVLDLFYWGNLLNNYIMAYLSASCLEVGSVGAGLATSITSGLRTVRLNYSPMTASQSPSEFWGRRWNTLVSGALKRGIFKPLRRTGLDRAPAALTTFVVSGLLHEYIILVMTSRDTPTARNVHPFGMHLSFFVWNAVVVILEHAYKDTPPIRWMAEHLPTAVRIPLVLLTVLPLAHLFTDVYVEIGFYSAFAVGFPRIVKL